MKLAKWGGLVLSLAIFSSCKYETSNVSGWDYNNRKTGGFQKVPFEEQETGPGLVLIEGGTFTMGRVEQDVTFDWNNIPRRVTVSSFYLDQFEITNFNYTEYLYWLTRTYGESYPSVVKNALPDTLVWREKLAYMEPYVEYYLRHPAYRDYPVVGVSWLQANDFCKWRTDRVNEYILIREGVLEWRPTQADDDVFNTDAYMHKKYEVGPDEGRKLPNLNPSSIGNNKKGYGERDVLMSDGILLPRYRLPTEAEWEYASYGLIGNTYDERIVQRRLYPWDGHWVRNPEDKFQGDMLANFVRGRGDYMGVAGKLNDAGDVTTPVDSYWPNDYGLYNMAGNVSEWVMDVYRPLSHEDFDEFRPFRGNVFKTKILDSEGEYVDKHESVNYDLYSMKEYLVDFKKVREENGRKDDVEFLMLDSITGVVDYAIALQLEDEDQTAMLEVEEIFNTLLVEDWLTIYMALPANAGLAQAPHSPDWTPEIAPMLREGLSTFVLHGEQENGNSIPGSMRWREVTEEENLHRRNYTTADNINYLDGDLESSHYYESIDMYGTQYQKSKENGTDEVIARINNDSTGIDWKQFEKNVMYQAIWDKQKSGLLGEPTTLISDRTRVYKGGSWRDRAYFMNAGTRRYLDEDKSMATLGFRCAMTRVGSPVGLGSKKRKR
jgi:formylglycine-generating enzyme required for sulfatase activity